MSHKNTEEEKNAAFTEEPEYCRDGKIIRLDKLMDTEADERP